MEQNLPRHSILGLIAAVTIGLIVAVTAAGYDLYFRTEILEQGDAAVNGVQIYNAKHLAEIYGNYSRFEFNHPGPGFFYIYAAGELILFDLFEVVPAPHNAHLLTSMALQCLCLAIALVILADLLRWSTWLPIAILGAALHFSQLYGAFTSIWPPHVLLMPFLAFMVACTAVAAGRVGNLPVMVGLGGLLFHGHVAQALFVGGMAVPAFTLCALHLRRDGQRTDWTSLRNAYRTPLLASAALVVLFLLPLGIDLVTRGLESNVATIIRRFLVNTEDGKTWLQALLYLASFATYSQDQEHVLASIGPETTRFFGSHAGIISVWITLVIGPAAGWIALRKHLDEARRRALVAAYAIFCTTLVLCFIWALAQAGSMHHFNGYFYHGVLFFGAAIGLGLVAWVLEGRTPAALGATICVAAAIVLTWSVRPPRLGDNESGRQIRNGVAEAVDGLPPGRPVVLSFEHHYWPEAASVALDLQRRGFPFYTVPTWNFMFGDPHDLGRLGAKPEDNAEVWWIAEGDNQGIPITGNVRVFRQPPLVSPLGTTWRFGRADEAFRHVVRGLSVGNVDRAWSEQPEVVFLLRPMPAETDVLITFEAEANNHEHDRFAEQPAIVRFAGHEIGKVAVGQRTEVSLRVPRNLWNSGGSIAKLEITFPGALHERSFSRPRAREYHAWGFWRIQFTPAP